MYHERRSSRDVQHIADLEAAEMQHQSELSSGRHMYTQLLSRIEAEERRSGSRKRQIERLSVRFRAAVVARRLDADARAAAEERVLDLEHMLGESRANVVLLTHAVWQAETNEAHCRHVHTDEMLKINNARAEELDAHWRTNVNRRRPHV